MCDICVTREECAVYRNEINTKNQNQDIVLTRIDTEVGFLKKIMYSILGVLISGFIGTIFAVLSIG